MKYYFESLVEVVMDQLTEFSFQFWEVPLIKANAPLVASTAQRKKMINEFWLDRVLQGCCGNPKITKTKLNIEPMWNKSGKFIFLLVTTPSSVQNYEKILAQFLISFWWFLGCHNIPLTRCPARIRWSFFSSKQCLQQGVWYLLWFWIPIITI